MELIDFRWNLLRFVILWGITCLPNWGVAQMSNDFELGNRDVYRADCWEFAGTTVTTNNPISGAQSGRFSTLNSISNTRNIITPWYEFSEAATVTFDFRETNNSSNPRMLLFLEEKATGTETQLVSVNSTTAVQTRTATFDVQGVYRLRWRMEGNGGSSQGRIDNIVLSTGRDVSDRNSYNHPNNTTGWGCDCEQFGPVAEPDFESIDEDSPPTAFNVTANDSDPDNDINPGATEIEQGPRNGIATVNAAGEIVYTPNENYFGEDTIVYKMFDSYPYGDVNFDIDTLFITVNPVNDAPIAVGDDSVRIKASDDPLSIDVLPNDTDIDNDVSELTITSVVSDVDGGTFEIRDGKIVFTPDPDFSGNITVTYTISDPGGASSTATFVIVVLEGEPLPPSTSGPIAISQGFSPNNDGINDFWFIRNIESFPDNRVEVYNRWGNLIYRTTGYDNRSIQWDGRSNQNSGTAIIDGTYFYVIQLNNSPDNRFEGFVVIHR